ncbi:hypothetical protein GGH92_004009, partial [Coemansia sp. RSA 2673]
MKLAEALILRADLDKSIGELTSRLISNSLVQEGTKPIEDPETLLKELFKKISDHEKLVVKINSANLRVTTEGGLTLTSAIAKRDGLKRLYGILSSVYDTASSAASNNRYSKTEIMSVTTVDAISVRKKMDKVAEQSRKIDVEI